MSQIRGIIDKEPTNDLVAEAFERDMNRAGKVLQITKVGGLLPKVYNAWTNMYDTTQTQETVETELKEIASLLVYMRVGCEMCLDFATVMARMKGVTEEKLKSLQHYKTSPLFSDVEKVVLKFAESLTRTPVKVTDEDFDDLKVYFNDTQIMELIFHITVTNMGGRIGKGLNLIPEGFSTGQFCLIPFLEKQGQI